ncbi:MAG: transposase [Candidatus Omnitrophica bacterium]|nr:transposase [Candidatus Omnitrophota bacterium]
MPRVARIVVVGVPHHVTQRGNYKQVTFKKRDDYIRYLSWLEKYKNEYKTEIVAYCLMPNHVHFIVIPRESNSLAMTFNVSHMRYAQYFNKKHERKGHLWQSRFYSCSLDEPHLYSAIRYVENNPVRANMVGNAKDWEWSSAKFHVSGNKEKGVLSLCENKKFIEINDWQQYLDVAGEKKDTEAELIRKHTRTGKPLGDKNFIRKLEKVYGKRVHILRKGRPLL